MANKLTRREKVLLYILLCLAMTAVLILLLILPGITRNAELRDSLETTRVQRQELERQKEKLEQNLETIEELEQHCTELYQELFRSNVTLDRLDKYVTEIAMANDISPKSLLIGSPEYTTVFAYASESEEEEQTRVLSVDLQLSGACAQAAFEKLVDAYARERSLHLHSFSYQSAGPDSSGGSFQISLQIYLLAAPGTGSGSGI